MICGLEKTSLIDYPGKISCVVFFTGCNFTCPYCHNPDLAKGLYPERIKIDQLKSFLDERRTFLDGVVISGGEPTLHSDLPGLCDIIRNMGLAVKLDTNGSNPKILDSLLKERLVDFVAMDIKTNLYNYKPPLCAENTGEQILQSIRLLMNSSVSKEFRTTCVRPFVTEAIIEQIARLIKGAPSFVLQSFNDKKVLYRDYFTDDQKNYSLEQLEKFRNLAAPFVQSCTLR
ncbi:MAG: anaerobic ribonucleoside-triphosphate reductase activating protein [Desulfobacteraceae bacterium]|nr:anaerobic ribonucleoside-triphosphate reductase activating protein [Desulfobacteraceae bacterium]